MESLVVYKVKNIVEVEVSHWTRTPQWKEDEVINIEAYVEPKLLFYKVSYVLMITSYKITIKYDNVCSSM